ncbi:MAG: hypothetical protein NTX42_09660 [Methanothrix sp.]|nr:hypothetical protein [Methanothrix sp.]
MESNVPTLPTGKTIEEEKPFIAKFQISREDAVNHYRDWIGTKSFVPKDLDIAGNLDKIKGIYVPIWLFEVSAKSDWRGGYNETHYRTVTKTKYDHATHNYVDYVDSEPYPVWKPMHGVHRQNYRILVPASNDITQAEIEKWPFEVSELQKYDATRLVEWDVVEAELNYSDASDICNRRIGDSEHKECKKLVAQLNDYNPQSTFNFSSLVLLPIFGLSYTYKDKPYSNQINGLTGEVYGKVPVDWIKKLLVIAALVVAVVAFVYFIISQNR